MEAIILAGGFGMRLRSVCADLPKPMAPVLKKPFLEHLLEYWKQQGISHFILSVGYLHQIITNYFGEEYQGIPIDYVVEKEPLGTGGGILQSIDYLHHPDSIFLVLNGDTFFPLSLSTFFHKGDVTLALHKVKINSRYHGIALGESNKIQNGNIVKSNLINAGCYLFHKKSLNGFQKKRLISLENEILPRLIAQGLCYGQQFDVPFIDIGVPEDYERSHLFMEMFLRN